MAGKGIGLNSIKSRVESMKGMIDIYSEPGKGTEINVEFHLDS
jgi:signal transduction histidine kinase